MDNNWEARGRLLAGLTGAHAQMAKHKEDLEKWTLLNEQLTSERDIAEASIKYNEHRHIGYNKAMIVKMENVIADILNRIDNLEC